MKMRIIGATVLVALLTFAIWAQRGQTPAAPTITASEVAAMIAKSPSDKNALGQRMLQLGSYNVNMDMTIFGINDLCAFSSWEESYHTPFYSACPVPVLVILHLPSPWCGAARGAILKPGAGILWHPYPQPLLGSWGITR